MKLLQVFLSRLQQVNLQLTINQSIKQVVCLIIISFFFSNISFSQSENQTVWSLAKKIDGIEVYSQRISCQDQNNSVPFDYIVFKVLNNSSELKKIFLKFEIFFDEGCNGCEGIEETSRELILDAGESIEASCSNFEDRLSYFILNPSFADSWNYIHSNVIIEIIK